MDGKNTVWIGFDPREAVAFAVCRYSINRRLTQALPVHALYLPDLQRLGLYTRPVERRGDQLWDPISDAPMSTEFACSRFLTPILAESGWALFMDCDILVRVSICRLFEQAQSQYAVMCVKHNHSPEHGVKMDGQLQVKYRRKNWSSFMLFNCDHPANKRLTLDMVNTLPGRDLHRFCWLEDDEIGELSVDWNYLVGHSQSNSPPKVVHYTDGIPLMKGYENCEYADEFRAELGNWVAYG